MMQVDEFQRHSLQSRLGIPLVYAGDAVHGMSLCRGTTIFPHNVGLGRAQRDNHTGLKAE